VHSDFTRSHRAAGWGGCSAARNFLRGVTPGGGVSRASHDPKQQRAAAQMLFDIDPRGQPAGAAAAASVPADDWDSPRDPPGMQIELSEMATITSGASPLRDLPIGLP
jgi:hypothetical protein